VCAMVTDVHGDRMCTYGITVTCHLSTSEIVLAPQLHSRASYLYAQRIFTDSQDHKRTSSFSKVKRICYISCPHERQLLGKVAVVFCIMVVA
jgi:hypothetical protein